MLFSKENLPTLYHPVYEFVQKTEPILLPLSAGSAGLVGALVSTQLVSAGIIGGLVGIGAGAIDIAAIYYEVYDTPYLTAGMLGYGAGSAFAVPASFMYAKNILCVSFGMLAATGVLTPYLKYTPALLNGVLYGSHYAGLPGAGVGFAAGVIDNILSAQNITHFHLLTTAMEGVSILSLVSQHLPRIASNTLFATLASNKIINGGIGATLSILNHYQYYNGTATTWFPFELKDELYDTHKSCIPEKQLQNMMVLQAVSMIAVQLVIQTILLDCAAHFQQIREVMGVFRTNRPEAWKVFKRYFPGALSSVLLYAAGFGVESFINSYFNNKLKYFLIDTLTDTWYTSDTLLKLQTLQKTNGTDILTLQKSLWADITETVKGAELVVKASTISLRGLYAGIFLLNTGAADVLILSSLYSSTMGSVTRWIARNQQHDAPAMEELKIKISSLLEYTRTSALTLAEENRISDVYDQYKDMNAKSKKMEVTQIIWDNLDSAWSQVRSYTNFMIGYLLVADKLFRGVMQVDMYLKTIWMLDDVCILLGFADSNEKSLISIKRSIGRIQELVPLLVKENLNDAPLNVIDYGNGYVVQKTHRVGSHHQVCFYGFSVKIGNTDSILTKADNICVHGSVVAVTGDSGSGKTTALRILKGLRNFGAYGNGTIEFVTQRSRAPKIVMASQEGSSTPFRTLLEDITSKYGDKAKAYEDKVMELITKLRVDAGSDASVMESLNNETGSRSLSGGQKQKVSVIRALLSEPDADVWIFDEIFAGLDLNSRIAMQRVLHEYLPNAMKFFVDHHAEENNTTDPDNLNGFYDSILHFNNISKTFDVLTSRQLNITSDDASIPYQNQECSGATAVECN